MLQAIRPVHRDRLLLTGAPVLGAFVLPLAAPPRGAAAQSMVMKTEHFDADPGWDGNNNRNTTTETRQITQDFGFQTTTHAGSGAGEVGGLITPAGEPAYYARVLPGNLTLNDPLSVSGKLTVEGGGHTVLGFFNTATVKEWRTANTVSLRLYGRGPYFYAYPEYGTSKWRAGAGSFPGSGDEFHFTSGATVHNFSLSYDPSANSGLGRVTATIDGQTTFSDLAPGHKADGATFNRFGIYNVIKSADGAGRFWVDDLTINGQLENFNANPNWDALRAQAIYTSANVRPRFNFGYSGNTKLAGGAAPGELGGDTFRGDSGAQYGGTRMAYYGDRLQQTLDLSHPLKGSGKVAFLRGVSDSTSLIGFFHSTDSMRSGTSNYATPENFVGAAIEGPSAEGFYFYPTYMTNVEGGHSGGTPDPYIYPDGKSHDWTLEYNPAVGFGRISLTLDGQLTTVDLTAADRQAGAHFNRFGMITTQIDGSGQTVYFDDLTYTVGVPEPVGTAWLLGGGLLALRRGRRR